MPAARRTATRSTAAEAGATATEAYGEAKPAPTSGAGVTSDDERSAAASEPRPTDDDARDGARDPDQQDSPELGALPSQCIVRMRDSHLISFHRHLHRCDWSVRIPGLVCLLENVLWG